MDSNSKVLVAGANGMVGSAIWRVLSNKGYTNLIGASSKDLDLRNQEKVFNYINKMFNIF